MCFTSCKNFSSARNFASFELRQRWKNWLPLARLFDGKVEQSSLPIWVEFEPAAEFLLTIDFLLCQQKRVLLSSIEISNNKSRQFTKRLTNVWAFYGLDMRTQYCFVLSFVRLLIKCSGSKMKSKLLFPIAIDVPNSISNNFS